MMTLSLSLEEENGKVKIPCPICKGEHETTHHTGPCDKGWIWVDKEKLEEWITEK